LAYEKYRAAMQRVVSRRQCGDNFLKTFPLDNQ
jgi:hypothetical protein